MNDLPPPRVTSSPLLEVSELRTHFFTNDGVVKAVDGVTFSVNRGEVFGLVGESGCGKTATALSILRLIDAPGRIIDGRITFDGQELLDLREQRLRKIRGRQISMIFQEPLSNLDPLFTIGSQVAEMFHSHLAISRSEALSRTIKLLADVGLPDAERKAHSYPHEISGGQAQRVMIAMALALDPQLLIADEPTTALDVTIQAQILDLIRALIRKRETAVILITHDLGVVAEMCDRVGVMYAGQIVEETDVEQLYSRPLHPYTQGLISSMPVLGESRSRLTSIPGTVPSLVNLPAGCRFAPRCSSRRKFDLDICEHVNPDLQILEADHLGRCWLYQDHGPSQHRAPLGDRSPRRTDPPTARPKERDD